MQPAIIKQTREEQAWSLSRLLVSKLPATVAIAVVLSSIAYVARPANAMVGTFRTTDLVVDDTAHVGEQLMVGSNLIAGLPPLELLSKTVGTIPLDFRAAVTNAWDLSPMTGSNVDPATVTVFGNTPTSTPSVDGSLIFKILAGTGGAGGVWLSPNGPSWMDPDGYAQHGHIFAIGHENPQYELDVRDPGNAHTSSADCVANVGSGSPYECIVVSAKGSSTFATGTGSNTEYYAVNGESLGIKVSGTATLTNIGLHGRAAGGDTNLALATDDGNVVLNRAGGGTALLHGVTTADAGSFHITNGGTIIEGTSPFTLSIGPTSDDTYFLNGNIAYGWNVNSDDHLNINFFGFLGGTGFFRSLNVYDGKNTALAHFNAPSHQVEVDDGGGIMTTVIKAINGHWITNGTSPTLDASCTAGGGSAIGGTDRAMKILTGVSSTACTVTFASPWTIPPVCTITPESGAAVPAFTISASQIVMSSNTNATYNIQCLGTPGAS